MSDIASLKLGRRPVDPSRPALEFAGWWNKRKPVAPPHPASGDWLKPLHGWQMLGNDQYGDCVAVTWANMRRVLTHYAGAERYPDFAQVQALYETQNPGFPAQDDGMSIQTTLEHLNTVGGPDGAKVVAFAKVDWTDPDELAAAISIFGAVWVGVNVQEAQMQAMREPSPVWDWVPGSPVEGGHSIVVGAWGQEACITWATEVPWTAAFTQHQVEECWAVVWPEHLSTAHFQAGINTAQLEADYQAITGRSL